MDILACPAVYSWTCTGCGFTYPTEETDQICSFGAPPRKCPNCGVGSFKSNKYYPLELQVLKENTEIAEGVILCPKCHRWYPIRDEIPELLPDELRDEQDELPFLTRWKDHIPPEILSEGKPFNLKEKAQKKH